jgi:ABC-type polysaccharide/polyol phosphate export permease
MESLKELLVNREVIMALVWRDLKTRYRGSVLGFLWTFLNPLLLMAIYSLVFSVYMRVDIPKYPIFVFAGLLPWLWFSSAVVVGANSIVEGSSLIKRVAFPPQTLPTVTVLATLINFLLALPLLFAFMLLSGLPVKAAVIAVPVTIAIQFVFTLGIALALSMLTVRYRDLQHLLGNLMTLWFFLTPVLYPPAFVPAQLQAFLVLNPMTSLIVSYQDALYHGRLPAPAYLMLAAVVAVATLGVSLVLCGRWRWTLVEEV